jgi:OHCU decarboxylase
MTTTRAAPPRGVIGESVLRTDGIPKVTGAFAYSSDLRIDGMLWGATLRSPHPAARIRGIDVSAAIATPGVHAVLTHEDVQGRLTYGMEIPDQPVLAWDEVRYEGEPVAIVAADHPETARRAAERVVVDYAPLEPLADAQAAITPGARALHASGNLLRRIVIRHGPQDAGADVVVRGEYDVGMQDQAFLGPESALAVPAEDGGVDLHLATQWLHVDQGQLAASLGLPPEKARLHLAGVGGAFGGREDLSMQIHVCMLALHTGRPVKMVYSREESFYGHVHRHPARMAYEHGATRDGRLAYVRARLLLDGGAYASSSTAVISNAACFACGPYEVPSASIEADMAYTNNPPCGAMRGFGAVQVAFAYESQMDLLAAALAVDPLDLRLRNALDTGSVLPTGQRVEGPAPVRELLERVGAMPLPPEVRSDPPDLRELPGGVANATHGEGVRRGLGYAVAFKNIAYAEGFDDHSAARVRVSLDGGEPLVEVHTAAAEVGQGLVTVQEQIARTELGVERVRVLPADTAVGSAGSSSASRQTWMTGGAVRAACLAVRERLADRAAERGLDPDDDLPLEALLRDGPVEETRVFRHRRTFPLDPETGQGDAHVAFAFAAHRAVCDVDAELGLVRVVEIACAQEVGRAVNPLAVEGQIEGGISQGLGLALMEEIQVRDGRIRNASFTDYLIPTILDMPPVRIEITETPRPDSPYGLTGVGEPPAIAATPAVVAALRQATGRPLTRVPVRPEHLVAFDPLVDGLNALDRPAFAERLWAVAEGSPWVAEAAWEERPFAHREALAAAFARAIERAPLGRQLALIRAHPELADRAAIAGRRGRDSAREQASAGLDALTAEEHARLTALTATYRERFGFPFVMAVGDQTPASITAALERRLGHEPDAERAAALREVGRIVELRLRALA